MNGYILSNDDDLKKAFNEERYAAVKSRGTKALKAFYNKWLLIGVYEIPLPTDEEVIKRAKYKMLYHDECATAEDKRRAEKWLTAHGYDTD